MDELNPYRSPETRSGEFPAESSVRLHSIVGVVIATFFGTPTGGGLLLAMNYWRTNQKAYAWSCFFGALLVTGIILIAALFIPDNIPDIVCLVPQLVLAHLVAKFLQGELLEGHRARGGRFSSRWAAVGWGLLCSIFIMAPLFVFLLFVPESMLPS